MKRPSAVTLSAAKGLAGGEILRFAQDDKGPTATVAERLAAYMRPGSLTLVALPPLSLYVHLPWCLQKCPYCDFNSHAVRGGLDALPERRYVDALVADLEAAISEADQFVSSMAAPTS